jgi:hypothetical protein
LIGENKMKKKLVISMLFSAVLLVLVVTSVFAGGTSRGIAEDPNVPALGPVKYLGNPAGYHFWFTVSADLSYYEAGHSYHNVYKLRVGDPSEWCGTTKVPNREPYNLVGHTGKIVYYKVWDTTTDTLVCP